MNVLKGLSEKKKEELLSMSLVEVYQAGYEAGKANKVAVEKYEGFAQDIGMREKSPNQQRAELIQRAREFVEGHSKDYFFAKQDNLIVAIHKKYDGRKNGYACCRPGDVSNDNIGKAIALARALEIPYPSDFRTAVQPTEVVVGMILNWNIGSQYRIENVYGKRYDFTNLSTGEFLPSIPYKNVLAYSTIFDDTNAIYEESK